MKALFEYYLALGKAAILSDIQYRVATYFYMIGMVTEPVIYLVVWSTIANAQGGQVAGYTAGAFTAYYIVWTLVRSMNIVFTPYGWEGRIRNGRLSGELMRPVHPIHSDIAFFAGMKVVWIILWLPIAAVLYLIFRPELHPTLLEVAVFFVAIWGAFLVRTMFLSILGIITFWTTRVGALYELYFALELILSGRMVPMALMPDWVQRIAWFLPFQWTFFFPINALVGEMTPQELFTGLGMQLAWIVVGSLVVNLMWKAGIKRYAAVGN
jgi:ABC-2 type transport system permease protein